jgi:hypothetical protein
MSEETKEAVRLLLEAADHLRRLDPQDGSLLLFKVKLRSYLKNNGLDDPVRATNDLCTAPISGELKHSE